MLIKKTSKRKCFRDLTYGDRIYLYGDWVTRRYEDKFYLITNVVSISKEHSKIEITINTGHYYICLTITEPNEYIYKYRVNTESINLIII